MRRYRVLKTVGATVSVMGLTVSVYGTAGAKQASAAENKVTNITIWTTELSADEGNKLANQFNAINKDVHVTSQYVTKPDQFLQKITAALSTSSEPAIVIGGDPSWGPQLLQSGKLVTLNGKVDAINKRIYAGLLSAEYYKGKQVGIPYGTGDYALYYNKTAFANAHIAKPPSSWKEVIQDSLKLTDASKNHYGIYVPFGSEEWTVWTFEGMLWGNGGEFLSKDNKHALFNSKAGVDALQTWVDLIHKYRTAPNTSFATPGNSDGSPAFASNVVSMLVDGGWDVSTFKQAKVNFGVTFFPKGSKTYATNAGIGNIWVFDKGSDQTQAALKYLNWFMQPKQLADVAVSNGALPVSGDVLKEPEYKNYLKQNPEQKVFAENMKYVHTRPTLVSYPEISKVLGAQLDKALHDQISPKDALDTAAKQADAVLKKNNE